MRSYGPFRSAFRRINPASLQKITVDEFLDLVVGKLGPNFAAQGERFKRDPVFREMADTTLKEAKKAQRQRQKEAIDRAKAILREQIAEQRKKERFGGQTGSVAGEDAERFASLPEVKTAITHMIQTLASLPPPGPGPLSDNVGFSGGTNTSMRNFLSRIEEGEDLPLTDWLDASRLLIVHSRTQLPRERVMGAVRFLEDVIGKSPSVAPGFKRLGTKPGSKEAYASGAGVLNLKKHEIDDKGGAVGWFWRTVDPTRVELILPQKLIRPIADRLKRKGFDAKLRQVGARRYADTYRLDTPLAAVPLVAQLLEELSDEGEMTKAPDKLRKVFQAWKAAQPEAASATPTPGPGMAPEDTPPEDTPSESIYDIEDDSAGADDYTKIYWKWTPEEPDVVRLAYGFTPYSKRTRGQKSTNYAGLQINDRAEFNDISILGENERLFPRGDTRYSKFYTPYPIEDVPKLYPLIEEWLDKPKIALKALKEVFSHWKREAGTAPKRKRKEKTPRDEAIQGSAGRISWSYDKGKNGVVFQFPYDTSRDRRNQISMALQSAGVLHRDIQAGGKSTGRLFLSPVQIKALINLMEKQNRFAGAVPKLKELLPFWEQLSAENIPAASPDDIEKAIAYARRFAYMMKPEHAEKLAQNIALYAPYLKSIIPQETTQLDLGPSGGWRVQRKALEKLKTKTRVKDTFGVDLRGLPDSVLRHSERGYGFKYPISKVLQVAKALDPIVPELALSLRAGLLIDEDIEQCPIQDYLADIPTLDQVKKPEMRRYIAETMRLIEPHLKPGMKLFPFQQVGVAYARSTGKNGGPPRMLFGDDMGIGKTFQSIATILTDKDNLTPVLVIAPTSVVANWPKEIAKFTRLKGKAILSGGGATLPDQVQAALRDRSWDFLVVGWEALPHIENVSGRGQNYQVTGPLSDAMKSGRIKSVILDEAHYAKNKKAKRSKIAKALTTAAQGARLLLTGTLILNEVGEAWYPLSMVDPVQFGEEKLFKKKYEGAAGKRIITRKIRGPGGKVLKDEAGNDRVALIEVEDERFAGLTQEEKIALQYRELADRLRCVMIRRLKVDVLPELPDKTRAITPLALSAAEKREYENTLSLVGAWRCANAQRSLAEKTAERLDEAIQSGETLTPQQALIEVAFDLTEGRKKIVDRDHKTVQEFELAWNRGIELKEKVSAAVMRPYDLVAWGILNRYAGRLKVPAAVQFIEDTLNSTTRPLVVFTRHQRVWDAIEDKLKTMKRGEGKNAKPVRYRMWTGKTPPRARVGIEEAFQRGELDLILASTALREGVTLTRGNQAIFAELWLNPAYITQAEDRLLRIGQENAVLATHLYAPDTHDEYVVSLIDKKSAIVDAVLGGYGEKFREGEKSGSEKELAAAVMESIEDAETVCLPTLEMIEQAVQGTLPSVCSFAPDDTFERGGQFYTYTGAGELEGSMEAVPCIPFPGMSPRRRNPAKAAVGGYQGATLTAGHFDEGATKKAAQIASRAVREGKPLGKGNFGQAYRVGHHVVKLPTAFTIHGKPRSRAEQREAFIHEAGVANELHEAGHRVVPLTVYVELADGTPALVREYGSVLRKVDMKEIAKLEHDLYAVEREGIGWDVADELLMMRRKDGSLFVADVGFWRKRKKPRTASGWDSHTDVPDLLSQWARSVDLPESVRTALYDGGSFYSQEPYSKYENTLFLFEMKGPTDLGVKFLKKDIVKLKNLIEARRSLGLFVPSDADAMVSRMESNTQVD